MNSEGLRDSSVELCQIITALNYDAQRTLVSAESFSKPNFGLVCNLLRWFARIVDPTAIDQSVNNNNDKSDVRNMEQATQKDQQSFLVDMGKLFASRLGIRLDLVALFRADSSCCGELLKIGRLVYEAAELVAKADQSSHRNNNKDYKNRIEIAMKQKRETMSDLFGLIDLSSSLDGLESNSSSSLKLKPKPKPEPQQLPKQADITNQQIFFVELNQLTRELDELMNREETQFNRERLTVIDRRLEVKQISEILGNSHDKFIEQTRELAQLSNGLDRDLITLDDKLRKKEIELDETRESLNDLLIIQSPKYLQTHDKLHKEFELVYDEYVSKYRNLMYLKDCIYSQSNATDIDPTDDDDDRSIFGSGLVGGSGSAYELAVAGGAREFEPASETVGPARLLESLLDTGSSSPKPEVTSMTSGLLTGEDSGGAAKSFSGAINEGAGTEAGLTNRLAGFGLDVATIRRDPGRPTKLPGAPADPREFDGLELEGLLNEFVLADDAKDSAGRDALDSSDQDGDEEDEEDPYDDDDDDEEEEEDEDEADGLANAG